MPGLKAFLPLVIVGTLFMRGCEETAPVQQAGESIGNVENGVALIETAGCGSCHIIPGIDNARGLVGPPLNHMSRRSIIAGLLQNTPANMITWLRAPQSIVPGNAMPDLGLTEQQARDITAYLYTLE
jgi:cytochrome c2